MTTEKVAINPMTVWSPNRTATRDLSDVFSHMMIKDLLSGGLDIIVSVSSEVFNWEMAERRADWEEKHGRFMEFTDVRDLLSDLHS